MKRKTKIQLAIIVPALAVFTCWAVSIDSESWYMSDGSRHRHRVRLLGMQLWESCRSDPSGLALKEPQLSFHFSSFRAFGFWCTENRVVDIKTGMTPLLKQSLAKTVRIEIHLVDPGRDPNQEKRIIRDVAAIQGVIDKLNVVYKSRPCICACAGDYLLEFYDGEHLIVGLTFHHFESIRPHTSSSEWDVFGGNLELTEDSKRYFVAFLSQTEGAKK